MRHHALEFHIIREFYYADFVPVQNSRDEHSSCVKSLVTRIIKNHTYSAINDQYDIDVVFRILAFSTTRVRYWCDVWRGGLVLRWRCWCWLWHVVILPTVLRRRLGLVDGRLVVRLRRLVRIWLADVVGGRWQHSQRRRLLL